MLNRQYVSMRLLSIIVAFTLAFGFMTAIQQSDSYADESTYPTTALKVVGATEEATWRILKTMPFKDHYREFDKQAVFVGYEMGTPVERTWNNTGDDDVVPFWSIKTSDLKACGIITGISLSKDDGTYIRGYYASDLDTTYEDMTSLVRSTDIAESPATAGALTIDGITPSSSQYDSYCFSYLAWNDKKSQMMTKKSYVTVNDENAYAEVFWHDNTDDLKEAKDQFNTIFTIYFNGEERKLLLDTTDMEMEAGNTNTRVAKTQSSYYGDAVVTYASNDESIATVDENGEVTGIAAGETSITASIKDGDKETSKSYKVIVSKASDPAVDAVIEKINTIGKVTLDKENAIAEAREAFNALTDEQKALVPDEVKTTLENAEKTIAALQLAAAKVAAKKAIDDKYDLTKYSGEERTKLEKAIADAKTAIDAAETVEAVDAAKTAGMAAADAAKTDEQIAEEKAEEIKKQKAAAKKYKVAGFKVVSKNRKFIASWKKTKGATGYQVQYKLKSAKKYKTLKNTTALKVTSKKLKKGKKYQFKVRTYKNVNGTKVYGKWSPVKTCKCKKGGKR